MQADLEIVKNTTIALLVLLIVTRVMGRRSIAQLTYFDYVIGITIGSIASSMSISKADIHQGIVSLVTSTALVLIINAVTRYSLSARKIINSVPIMVIYIGQILEENMRGKYYNINDLLEQLREKGIFNPEEVEVAIAETDGQLSVLKKPQFQSVIAKNLDIANAGKMPKASKCISKELIIAGKIVEQNLIDCGVTTEWLKGQLKAQGVKKVAEVTVAMLTPQGALYIDKSSDNVPADLEI
ncbi:MAG: DUF421 domain-containing protein [Pelosinus sp.]|nr:DUF421 domain-containing protein [Pelosinus sp.]